MNRLQSKCLVASALTHTLLFGVLVVGPAFLHNHDPADDLPPLEMIPNKLIDEPFQGGGGNPKVKQPAAPAVQPPPAVINPAARKPEPDPTPPAPEPVKPAPRSRPEPAPPKPEKDPEDVPQKLSDKSAKPPKPAATTKPAPTKKPVQVNLALAKRTNANAEREAKAEAQARAEAAAARARVAGERRELWNSTVRGLSSNLSSTGMAVEMPGPGGEAYANYRQFVKSIYDWAWTAPEDISDDTATVLVHITISRDGTVKRSEIVTRSGIPALDKSVQSALNRVRSIGHPFPEGAKEDERDFRLHFNLKSKRSAG